MRYHIIDTARGGAIMLMICYHIVYMLESYYGMDLGPVASIVIEVIGIISRYTFLLVAGMSFYFASKKYSKQELRAKYIKRSAQIGFFALLITLVTYIANPEFYIKFGILHFFALSFLILAFMQLKDPAIYLIIGISIFVSQIFVPHDFPSNILAFLGFYNSYTFSSLDFFPLIPYFGLLSMGVGLGYVLSLTKFGNKVLTLQHAPNILSHIGKYSLQIYVLHGILIYLFLYIVQYLV